MRHLIRRRVWKRLFWGLALTLTTLGLGSWAAYWYATDSATLAAAIRRESPRYLPGSYVAVERARVHPLVGEVNLVNVAVWQELDGRPFQTLKAGWIKVSNELNLAELARGRLVPREVVVAQPRLRLRRRKDGTWNLKGLLADPWPGPPGAATPAIVVQNGSVEVVEADGRALPVIRELTARVEAASGPGPLRFRGTARGEDLFDRLDLEGTFDPQTGRLALTRGDLARLTISPALRQRLPEELRAGFDRIGLARGEVDVAVGRLDFDPKAPQGSPARLGYAATARLRSGAWACRDLPFPLNDVSAVASVKDGAIKLERAEGSNGKTTARAEGAVGLDGSADVRAWVNDLELDDRLRRWTPPEFAEEWRNFKPKGRVSLAARVVKPAGGPPDFGLTVECRDVAMEYLYFPYPLDHASGTLTWQGTRRILVDVHANVGGKPASCVGTIEAPGPDARVRLKFEAEAFPVDEALFRALPPEVRTVVGQFHPTGRVRVEKAVVTRVPIPGGPPEGKVDFDAALVLTEDGRCEIKWDGMPYPVTQVTGRLELHPHRWIIKDMRGRNNLATIRGSGQVDELAPGKLKVDLRLAAGHLPFDRQLRDALPREWKAPWGVLNPLGSTAVDATIRVEPGKPDHYHVAIRPEPDTQVKLVLAGVGPGAGPLAFPAMEGVTGRFVYDDGLVTMNDVTFQFHGAPVEFRSGDVRVWDTGRFVLRVYDLHVTDFRVDATLRQLMPPVMAQFAHRLDEARTFSFRTDLGLGWSGKPGDSPRCLWSNGLVILNDNAIQAGLPIEHIQGQLEDVKGSFDGKSPTVHGVLNLDSVAILGQQVTQLRSRLDLADGRATLGTIRGNLLDGELTGAVNVGLDATPTYESTLAVRDADLRSLAETIPNKQSFRGKVSGKLSLTGFGYDVHTLQGRGEAHIVHGDLGELPVALRLFKLLNFSRATKTAFDTADVALRVRDGKTFLDPIQLTGDAFSLRGLGTLDPQGDVDLRLRLLYGRDAWHIRGLSDLISEASGKIFDIHVTGAVGSPRIRLEALPLATDTARTLGGALRPARRRAADPEEAPRR